MTISPATPYTIPAVKKVETTIDFTRSPSLRALGKEILADIIAWFDINRVKFIKVFAIPSWQQSDYSNKNKVPTIFSSANVESCEVLPVLHHVIGQYTTDAAVCPNHLKWFSLMCNKCTLQSADQNLAACVVSTIDGAPQFQTRCRILAAQSFHFQ